MKLYIFDNGSVRIDESLSTSFRSSIELSGEMMYERTDWSDKRDITIFLEEKVDWLRRLWSMKMATAMNTPDRKFHTRTFHLLRSRSMPVGMASIG